MCTSVYIFKQAATLMRKKVEVNIKDTENK